MGVADVGNRIMGAFSLDIKVTRFINSGSKNIL